MEGMLVAYKHGNFWQRGSSISVSDHDLDEYFDYSQLQVGLTGHPGPASAAGISLSDQANHHRPNPTPTATVFGGPIPDSGNPMLDALLADGKWDNSKPI